MDVSVPWRLLARIAVVGMSVGVAVRVLTPLVAMDQSRPAALLMNAIVAGGVIGIALWFLAVENRDRTFILKVFQQNA